MSPPIGEAEVISDCGSPDIGRCKTTQGLRSFAVSAPHAKEGLRLSPGTLATRNERIIRAFAMVHIMDKGIQVLKTKKGFLV